jgi:hypothetical protein
MEAMGSMPFERGDEAEELERTTNGPALTPSRMMRRTKFTSQRAKIAIVSRNSTGLQNAMIHTSNSVYIYSTFN